MNYWILMQSEQMIAMTTIGAITTGVVTTWLLIRLLVVIGAGEALGEIIDAIADAIGGI